MRRLAIYLFFDVDGIVDDYVPFKLRKLREHVDTILVIANEPLTPSGRDKLEAVADQVLTRENRGYDVGAYQDALRHVGWDRLADFDELILLNYTFFGPVHPFGDLFDRMDGSDVDFWGLTEHREARPNPFRNPPDPEVLPAHIQSTWITVRGRMLRSPEFVQYWESMPPITSYDESVLLHESRFTQHFADRGFTYEVAYPEHRYPTGNASLDHAELLLDDGCPMVKRRVFFMNPVHMDRHAILARRALDRVAASGYPMELLWQNLTRTTPARVLQTNLALLEVLSDEDTPDPVDPPRVVVVAHVYYVDMVEEILARALTVPGPFDLVVTTDTEEKRQEILAALGDRVPGELDVRVVAANRGRDITAFLLTCEDVLAPGRYDLVCKIHTKKSPQDGHNASLAFKEHLFDNLLASRGYVVRLLRLFQADPTLGAVFPPVVAIGYPTLGHAWFGNREGAQELGARLGVHVPMDADTPVAPLGSMFWARPEALAPLVGSLGWDDFPEDAEYGDGSITHVVERLFGYAVLSRGFHVRAVMSPRSAARHYTMLEHRLQLVSSRLPAYTQEQLDHLAETELVDNPLVWLKRRMSRRHPRAMAGLRPLYRAARKGYRGLHAVAGRRR